MTTQKNLVTANGIELELYKEFEEHMEAHADVRFQDIIDAVSRIDYNGAFFMAPIDLGHVVGVNHLICRPTDEKVQMLHRKGRAGVTPCVFHQVAPATTKIVVGIAHDDGKDVVFTAFYGELSPREPWDESIQSNPELLKESKDFWAAHALIVTEDQIDWSK